MAIVNFTGSNVESMVNLPKSVLLDILIEVKSNIWNKIRIYKFFRRKRKSFYEGKFFVPNETVSTFIDGVYGSNTISSVSLFI